MSPTQSQIVTRLVLENPGKTASELAGIGELDQIQLVRRLSELRSSRAVRKGEQRKCEITGAQAATWWGGDDKVKRLPVKDVRIDGGTQPRESIDDTLVAEYAEAMKAGDKFPAVVVFLDGVSYWLADGFHRTHAARTADIPDLLAEIHSGTRRDAVLYSVSANSAHGQRRTNADKRKAVMTLLEDGEWSQWANRDIARQCAVSHSMVNDLRRSLSLEDSSSEQPAEATRSIYTTKHGTTSTMNTANIGKRSRSRRVADITHLAAEGHSAQQIANEIGVSIEYVRQLAREEQINLPDKAMGRRAHIDANRVIEQTVTGLEGYASGLPVIGLELPEVTQQQAEEWVDALNEALKPINQLRKRLKEIAYD